MVDKEGFGSEAGSPNQADGPRDGPDGEGGPPHRDDPPLPTGPAPRRRRRELSETAAKLAGSVIRLLVVLLGEQGEDPHLDAWSAVRAFIKWLVDTLPL